MGEDYTWTALIVIAVSDDYLRTVQGGSPICVVATGLAIGKQFAIFVVAQSASNVQFASSRESRHGRFHVVVLVVPITPAAKLCHETRQLARR